MPPGDAAPLKFKMYALLGQQAPAAAAAVSDPEIKPVEGLLKSLPYTSYEKIAVDEKETPDGVETQFTINPAYSLVVRPNGRDGQGAAKLDIHVDLTQDGNVVKALTAQASAKPGDALLLRGMPLPPGELVVVLQRDSGDQNGQSGQGDQDQQQQDQQQQQKPDQKDASKDKKDEDKQQDQNKSEEKKQDEKKDGKEAGAEEKDDQNQPSPEDAKKDQDDKKDSKNLESILQSLEDVDRKEQSEVRNKRDRIDFKGGWW